MLSEKPTKPLTGKRGEFARIIVAALPEQIDFTQAAIMTGCSPSSAAQQGSRWAKRTDVREYVISAAKERGLTLDKWGMTTTEPSDPTEPTITPQHIINYLNTAPTDELGDSLNQIAQIIRKRQGAEPPNTPQAVLNYLRSADTNELSELIYDIANVACERAGTSGTPEQVAEMIMKDPLNKVETRLAAAKSLMKQTPPPKTTEHTDNTDNEPTTDLYAPYAGNLN